MARWKTLSLALLGLVSFGSVADARSTPAATLLVPYFEIDLDDPLGRNTLFSVGNATSDRVLAHVVLWTDWSVPTLAFDLLLGVEAIRPLNLRQILVDGALPVSGAGPESVIGFPSCASPLELPPLGVAERAALRAQHTGKPHPEDGLCYGSARAEGSLAVGFVTVDVVNDCSDSIVYPSQAGYFRAGGTGRASNENALWGDVFLIDSSDDSAQGIGAVAIHAGAEHSGPAARTFYRNYSINSIEVGPEDGREPLGCRSRTRFLDGGGFDGGTDLILWTELSFRAVGGRSCASEPTDPLSLVEIEWRNEVGGAIDTTVVEGFETLLRVHVGELPGWSPGIPFGTADVSAAEQIFWWNPPGTIVYPVQSLVVPIYQASGRFSAALEAAALDGGCE